MTTIDDLPIPSITDISRDEAIELLRTIRLSRRIPVKKQSKSTIKKKLKAKAVLKPNADQAKDLLKLLGG